SGSRPSPFGWGLHRSRSGAPVASKILRRRTLVRLLALTIAFATAVIAATIIPSMAAGESTTATLIAPVSGSSQTFPWTYVFHQNGGNGLSNIAVGFCSPDVLADVVSATPSGALFPDGVPAGHSGFGPGVKFDVTAPAGTL